MFTALIRIRLKQLARQGKNAGFIYGLLVVISVVVAAVCYRLYGEHTNALYAFSGLTVTLISIHLSRKDQDFIYHHLQQPQRAVFCEYLFFTLPVTIPFLVTRQWYLMPLFAGILLVLSYFKTNQKERTRLKKLSSLIPAKNIELISGFRRTFIPVIICYLLAACTSQIRVLPLFFLWLITLQVMSWYNTCEPLDILRANDEPAKRLLHRKLLQHTVILFCLYLPVLILNAFFVEGFVWVNVLFLLLQASMICFAICYKYSRYQPNTVDNGSIISGLVAFSGIVPFLLPVPAVMCVSYYFKARTTLNEYLS